MRPILFAFAALLLCSGQVCVQAPVPDVPDSGSTLDGPWVITYDVPGLAPDCLSIAADTVVSYDAGCNGSENLVSPAPVVYDNIGPLIAATLDFGGGSAGNVEFFLTPAGDAYLVEGQGSDSGVAVAVTGIMSRP